MTLLKDLEVGDIVFIEENKVPAKYMLVNNHVEYTTECGTIEYRSTLLRVDLFVGTFVRGYPLLFVSENGTWIDDSGILHGKEEDE